MTLVITCQGCGAQIRAKRRSRKWCADCWDDKCRVWHRAQLCSDLCQFSLRCHSQNSHFEIFLSASFSLLRRWRELRDDDVRWGEWCHA